MLNYEVIFKNINVDANEVSLFYFDRPQLQTYAFWPSTYSYCTFYLPINQPTMKNTH